MIPSLLAAALAIEIPWSPDIVEVGGFLLTWHGLFTAIGVLGGVNLSLWVARRIGFDPDDAYTLALVGVPSGIVGARALFVAEHWDFYGSNPGEIIALTEGGISVWGAILGGVLGALLFALWRGIPVGRGLDAAAPGLILGQAIGRVGDLINGEHLARATDLPWGVIYTHPDSPAFAHSLTVGAHHPATTYELLGDLAILAALGWLLFGVFRDRPGLTFCFYLVAYAVMRFLVTYTRVDSSETLGLRVPQLVSVIVVLVMIPVTWYFLTRYREEPPSSPPGRVPVVPRQAGAARAARRRARRGR